MKTNYPQIMLAHNRRPKVIHGQFLWTNVLPWLYKYTQVAEYKYANLRRNVGENNTSFKMQYKYNHKSLYKLSTALLAICSAQ